MQQMTRWEHAVGDVFLDDEIIDSFPFFRNGIILGGPRPVWAKTGRVFQIYTDPSYDALYECGVGGLGVEVIDGNGKLLSYFSTKVGARQVADLNLQNKDTIIFELEAFAVLVGCLSLSFGRHLPE